MKYVPLIELQVKHAYYADDRCPDFRIEPTAATQQLLRNHRCVLKSLPNGIRILMAVVEQTKDAPKVTPFIPLAADAVFGFTLHQRNADFALFTELAEFEEHKPVLYTNARQPSDHPGQLEITRRRAWATDHFVVGKPTADARFILRGRPIPKLTPSAFDVIGDKSVFRVGVNSLDFRISNLPVGSTQTGAQAPLLAQLAEPQGKPKVQPVRGNAALVKVTAYDDVANTITVDSRSARPCDRFSVKYEVQAQQARDVFAQVEIHCNETVPQIGDGPADFQIVFTPKNALWRYYIITDRNEAGLKITNAEPGDSLCFKEDPDPKDATAASLVARYAGKQIRCFVADRPIPCRQTARTGLSIEIDSKTDYTHVLPNPALSNQMCEPTTSPAADPKQPVLVSLFHVVKIFAQ